jgi:glucokinase
MGIEAAVGVDIGGTKINLAIVDCTGKILLQKIVSTQGELGAESVMSKLVEGITELLASNQGRSVPARIIGIGIGSAGQIDNRTGTVVHALDAIDEWLYTPIKQIVESKFAYPVFVDNDVNVIAVAEKCFGAGKSLHHFVCLALGTGVGGAIIQDGRLAHGVYGGAGELGHISIDFNGPRCVCGNYGCLELYASGRGIAALANAKLTENGESSLQSVDSRKVIESWKRGETWACDVMQVVIHALSAGISSIIHTFNPEAVFIGGGVSEAGDEFFQALSCEVQRRTHSAMWEVVRIMPTTFGTHSGVIGAAAQSWAR